jgi:hypothetical protein
MFLHLRLGFIVLRPPENCEKETSSPPVLDSHFGTTRLVAHVSRGPYLPAAAGRCGAFGNNRQHRAG